MDTRKKRVHYSLLKLMTVTFLATFMAACSGSGSGSGASESGMAVSGTINVSNATSSVSSKVTQLAITPDDLAAFSTNLALYSVVCSTTSTPVKSGTGQVNADGTFVIHIEGGENQPLSCYLVDSSGTKQADFLISDSSTKDLNGNSETSTTATFTSDADLGVISFDPNSGEVTVPKANVASVLNTTKPAAGDVFDPTGSWTIGAVDFSLPGGVQGPCNGGGGGNCQGPPSGQAIYLKLWKGLQISDNSDLFGLQVWDSQSKFTSCGSKIGLTPAIKTDLGVDFSANTAADAVFTFANSVPSFFDSVTNSTSSVTLTNHWQMSTATTLHEINPSCGPHDVTIASVLYPNAWVCGPDSSSKYQVQLGGGCKDSSNNPVNLTDWSGITCGAPSTNADGIKSFSCSGNASIDGVVKAVTCSNKWAVTNSSYVVQPSGNFNWTDLNASKIPSSTSCSAIANGASSEFLKIAQQQCYAEYFYASGMANENACLPKVEVDWSATTSANFAKVDDIRPEGLVFFEKYNSFADGSGGTLLTRQEHYEGVQVNGNNWVNCRVIETGGLSIKKITANKLLATFQSSTITTSVSKPACLAQFNGSKQSFMFYLTK